MSDVTDEPSVLEGLRSDNLSTLVFESIRSAIVNRSLAPGSRLTETRLAEQLNVSKTPVREALVKLREVGLIEPDGRRGGRVIRPSRKTLEDAYAIREALEVFTARHAAQYADQVQRGLIREAAARSLDGARAGDIARFREGDDAFHRAITVVAANERLSAMVENSFALIVTLRRRDLPDQDISIECGDAHVAIAAAIDRQDPPAAESLMRDHIDHIRGFVVSRLEQSFDPPAQPPGGHEG